MAANDEPSFQDVNKAPLEKLCEICSKPKNARYRSGRHSQVRAQTKSETETADKTMTRHLELTFESKQPIPPHQQGFLMAAEKKGSLNLEAETCPV